MVWWLAVDLSFVCSDQSFWSCNNHWQLTVECTTRLWSYSAGWGPSASGTCQKNPDSLPVSLEIQMWNTYLPGLPWCISVDSVPGVCSVVINLHCNKCFIPLTKQKKTHGCLRRCFPKRQKCFYIFFSYNVSRVSWVSCNERDRHNISL